MRELRPLLAAAFREAASAIDPAGELPATVTPARVEAWVCVESIRGQTRWIEAAVGAAKSDDRSDAPASAWLSAWCRAWASRAAPDFRKQADTLAPTIPDEPSSVPALLAYWRITGRNEWLERALRSLPQRAIPGDLCGAEAFRQAWRATASADHAEASRRCYDRLADLPLEALPGACELLGHEDLEEERLGELVDEASPESVVLAAAALGLPRLLVKIEWWIERELYEGPVAEAITYPWPALEVRFSKLASRDQVRFVPTIDGTQFPVIEDAGVVGAGLSSLLSDVDKSAFLEAAGRRKRSLRRSR